MTGRQQIYEGAPAADGIAMGSLHIYVRRQETIAAAVADPIAEKRKLERARDAANKELGLLLDGLQGTAREIMEFQSEMLNDEDFLAPILSAITKGQGALAAWRRALKEEMALYKRAEDSYMRERYADIKDIFLRMEKHLAPGGEEEKPDIRNAILVADDLAPSEFLALRPDQLRGIAMLHGSPNSHVAILARARRVPLVVNMRLDPGALVQSEEAVLDGENGRLICHPNQETLASVRRRLLKQMEKEERQEALLSRPTGTGRNESIRLLINLNDPTELDRISAAHCDGIGLVRTEFLFTADRIADEEEQLAVYRRLMEWAGGKPVTVRTMDLGGDKPMAGISVERETNPFLGLRGLRFSLRHRDLFMTQLRALCRASVGGAMKIMVPMITVPTELQQVRLLLGEVVARLKEERVEYDVPPLGIMVEVPAAAIRARDFAADFYSIGTNDLLQYTMAAARDSDLPEVYGLADPTNPALLDLIRRVVKAGGKAREVSVCGDMAADDRCIPTLLEQGVRTLSVMPAAIYRVKRTLNLIA